jgi:hypothetical protein
MHLQAFPFDQQTLHLTCRSEDQSKEELVFVVPKGTASVEWKEGDVKGE